MPGWRNNCAPEICMASMSFNLVSFFARPESFKNTSAKQTTRRGSKKPQLAYATAIARSLSKQINLCDSKSCPVVPQAESREPDPGLFAIASENCSTSSLKKFTASRSGSWDKPRWWRWSQRIVGLFLKTTSVKIIFRMAGMLCSNGNTWKHWWPLLAFWAHASLPSAMMKIMNHELIIFLSPVFKYSTDKKPRRRAPAPYHALETLPGYLSHAEQRWDRTASC